MPVGSKVTAEEVAHWRALRELGWTFQRIGDATGRHAVTVWDHLNGKLQGPPRERIIMPEEVARWRDSGGVDGPTSGSRRDRGGLRPPSTCG